MFTIKSLYTCTHMVGIFYIDLLIIVWLDLNVKIKLMGGGGGWVATNFNVSSRQGLKGLLGH